VAHPEHESPFDWNDLQPDPETQAQREAELREHADRCARVFRDSPDGAKLLNDWRRSTVQGMRGPTARETYTLGYMDGQADMVRHIDSMIRHAEGESCV